MNQATLDNMALAYHAIQLNQPALAKQWPRASVNKFAMPNVGEAYETYRRRRMPPLQIIAGTPMGPPQLVSTSLSASATPHARNYARKHKSTTCAPAILLQTPNPTTYTPHPPPTKPTNHHTPRARPDGVR